MLFRRILGVEFMSEDSVCWISVFGVVFGVFFSEFWMFRVLC